MLIYLCHFILTSLPKLYKYLMAIIIFYKIIYVILPIINTEEIEKF